jgi:hypothetical protein
LLTQPEGEWPTMLISKFLWHQSNPVQLLGE